MKLSILIPSKRPESLKWTLKSFAEMANSESSYEIIILEDIPEEDDIPDYVEYHGNVTVIKQKKRKVLNICELMHECYKLSTGNWIMLANDDVTMETKDWDLILTEKIQHFPDELVLFWPDDKMFSHNLSCFPILSRKAIELIQLFPVPYRRYKLDDTIHRVFPPERRVFIGEITLRHGNDKGEHGYEFPDGRIYPIDKAAAEYDEIMWNNEAQRRTDMRTRLSELIYPVDGVRVLIGVPTGEMARRADFYDYFNTLEKPLGTLQSFCHGQSPAKSRNMLVEQALMNNATHVLFLDDDIAFHPDLLLRLMHHNKDIVTALHLRRNFPHFPYIFRNADGNGSVRQFIPSDETMGLVEIDACGFGAVLIKIDVFKKLEQPWIRLGELVQDEWCDDIGFFKRVREAGFRVYCDLNTPVGHFAALTVWPARTNNQWHIEYDTMGSTKVSFPAPKA